MPQLRCKPIQHSIKSKAYFVLFFLIISAFTVPGTSDAFPDWNNNIASPTGSQLYAVSNGNNTFVAVGQSGAIVTSPDGSTWTERKNGGSNWTNVDLFGVAYGNYNSTPTFVAVGNVSGSAVILTSTDNGANWTPRVSGTANALYAVAYGSNRFVAVGTSGTILISADGGSTWAPSSSCASDDGDCTKNLFGVAFGNNTFVAVGQSGVILTSADNGANWTETENGGSNWYSSFLYGVAFGNNTFVTVGFNATILKSANNGSTWTSGTIAAPATSQTLRGINFGYGTFVTAGVKGALTSTILTSTDDGVNWQWSTSGTTNSNDYFGVAYVNYSFVAVGSSGKIIQSNPLAYTITASTGDNGSVTPSGATVVSAGGSQAYSITPAVGGYHRVDVLVDGSSNSDAITSGSYTFSNVSANHTISATFAQNTYTITVNYEMPDGTGGGVIKKAGVLVENGQQITVNHGDTETFSIVPNTGSHIVNVKIDNVSQDPDPTSYSFGVAPNEPDGIVSNHTIYASFAADTFSISASSNDTDKGTLTCDKATAAYGSNVQCTVTELAGNYLYAFTDNTIDKITSLTGSNPYTYLISNVTAAHTVVASFAANTSVSWDIVTNKNVSAGTLSCTPDPVTDHGGSSVCTVTAPANGNLQSLVLGVPDGGNNCINTSPISLTSGQYTITNVKYARCIEANFGYNITVSPGSNGAVTASGTPVSGSVAVAYGVDKPFVVSPDANYHIKEIKIDDVAVPDSGGLCVFTNNSEGTYKISAVCTFANVIAAHTLSATFEIDKKTITASAGQGGSLSPSGTIKVDYGTNKTFMVLPTGEYQISEVKIDGAAPGSICEYKTGIYTCTLVNIVSNRTITAAFALKAFTITASAGAGGSISPAGAVTINYNGSQEFTVTPDTGYHVVDVKVDGQAVTLTNNKYTVSGITSGSHTIAATFAIDQFTVAATAGTGGTISPSGNITANYNTSQEFEVAAGAGYSISGVKVNGTAVTLNNNKYTISNIKADQSIEASFSQNTYAITASFNSGGTVSCSATALKYGESSTCSIAAASDIYHIADVKVDGVSVGAVGSYAFNSVSSSHTISAVFEMNQNTYTVSVDLTTGRGTGSVTAQGIGCGGKAGTDCSETYNSGTSITLTAEADASSVFGGWSSVPAGICSGDASTCSITVGSDVSVSAIFSVLDEVVLIVSKPGTGSGNVVITPKGESCGTDCFAYKKKEAKKVTLKAYSGSDSLFAGWEGDCAAGIKTSCAIVMQDNRAARAKFEKKTPQMSVVTTSLVFGGVPVNKPKTLTVKISNSGTGDLQITGLSREGDNAAEFSAVLPGNKIIIKSKKFKTLKVTFKPVSAGPKSATLKIVSNDETNPPNEVAMSGTGVAKAKKKKTPQPAAVAVYEDEVTRQEMAASIYYEAECRSRGVSECQPAPTVDADTFYCEEDSPFIDVLPDSPYCGYIKWVYELGIVEEADYYFYPEAPVTREQAETWLLRAFPR